MPTIEFHSVKGGSGCTTVATLFALQLHRGNNPVHLSTAGSREQLGDIAAILGIPIEESGPTTVGEGFAIGTAEFRSDDVIDVVDVGGRYPWSVYTARRPRLLVIRNDYLSLRRALAMGGLSALDGVVLVEDPTWPLGNGDVSDVLGLPVTEVLTNDASFQRHMDAGLLAAERHPHFFHSLDRVVGVR